MFPSLPSRFAAAAVDVRAAFSRTAIVRGALVAAALAVSACNTNNVLGLRPDVDVGTQTAAVPSGSGGMQDLVPDDPYLQAADERATEAAQAPAMDQPAGMSQPVDVVQPIDDSPSADVGQPADESQPIDIAQMMQPTNPAPALTAPAVAAHVLVAPADPAPAAWHSRSRPTSRRAKKNSPHPSSPATRA